MVFYYTIRGGRCRNGHSHITLAPEDICCYVGRDKHENEYLIKYGWPGDIWFHVEGLSSAHVYFRLDCFANSETVNPEVRSLLGKIPVDDLPLESVEDMCQIVKHNSIRGCKMASCRIVYTPHSNLKKTFDMDSGTVTYHDTKLQRFRRCDKDRKRIKELEATKSADITDVDYYEEMKTNERRIIELKKKLKLQGSPSGGGTNDVDIYDPVLNDLRGQKARAHRMGDEKSGLEAGLAALEGLALGGGSSGGGGSGGRNAGTSHNNNHHNANRSNGDAEEDDQSHLPIWQTEANDRLEHQSKEIVRFLMARGYTPEEIQKVTTTINDVEEDENDHAFSVALSKLWTGETRPLCEKTVNDNDEDFSAMIYQARSVEKEVLEAIYGEDDHVQFGWRDYDDDESKEGGEVESDDDYDLSSKPFSFDSILPVPGYEPPPRYELPPPLLLEIYVDHGISNYPYGRRNTGSEGDDDNNVEPPVLAVVGGGLPSAVLRNMTEKLRDRSLDRSSDAEPGEAQIFDLLQIAAELAEEAVADETRAIEEERAKKAAEDRRAAKEEAERMGLVRATTTKLAFRSEADRRAYAQRALGGSGR